MDVMLERILSLIPKKEDGKFQHGALKEFANSIGLKSGNLISDWMHNRSQSYRNYLYEISDKYNVSVEWLKGETEKKEKPAPNGDELCEKDKRLIDWFRSLPREKQQAILIAQDGPADLAD